MNEVVKYSNELHELSFSSLTEAQQNVLFTLLQQFRNTDSYTLELDFNRIFELASIAESTLYRKDILKRLKYLQIFTFMYETNDLGDLAQEVIFPKIETDTLNKVLKIKVSKAFKDRYINSPLKSWTRFELAEFVWLNGTYTKTIYRYLKQYRTQGRWRVKYKDFKKILGIPESYRARDIDKRILNPSIKALSEPRNIFETIRIPFENLSVTKNKNGREIESLEFTFMPQAPTMLEKDIEEQKRNLTIIANEIKRKNIQKQQEKQHPLTGETINELTPYIGRHFRVRNTFLGGYDTCKIKELNKTPSGQIYGVAINQENNSTFELNFESLSHLKNALNLD